MNEQTKKLTSTRGKGTGIPCDQDAPQIHDPNDLLNAEVPSIEQVNGLLHKYADDPAVMACIRALGVMVLTPGIRRHLTETDPNALRQAEAALSWRTQQ